VPDPLLVDKVPGFEKGSLRTNGDGFPLYPLSQKPFVFDFHSFTSFLVGTILAHFAKSSQKFLECFLRNRMAKPSLLADFCGELVVLAIKIVSELGLATKH
jgi:hypothetical protein